jgi:hypothetical protein
MVDKYQQYRDAVKSGFKEYGELAGKKKQIDSDLNKLIQLITANVNMLPEGERERVSEEFDEIKLPSGFSDAIWRVLSPFEFMSATDVRAALEKSGYDLSNQSNALASIHTTLRRFPPDKVISKLEKGKLVYRRKGLTPLKNF